MASAAFHFASQGSGLKYVGTAGGTVVATLDSVNGVDYANWTIDGKDETSSADWSLSATTGNSITVTLPASGDGKSMILRCTVNGDPDLTATAKIYIAPEVGAVGERSESDANYGQAAFLNPVIRSAVTFYSRWDGSVETMTVGGINILTVGGDLTPSMPAITAAIDGRAVVIKVVGPDDQTLSANGSNTFDGGGSTYTIVGPNGCATFIADYTEGMWLCFPGAP